jgi:hypothetical protein
MIKVTGLQTRAKDCNWSAVLKAVLCLCVSSLPAIARADSFEREISITPFFGYVGAGTLSEPTADPTVTTNANLKSGSIAGIAFDVASLESGYYELLYSRHTTSIEGTVPIDLTIQLLQLGGIATSQDASKVSPYFALTVGAAKLTPKDSALNDETHLALTAGGGVRVPFGKHLAMRVEVRGLLVRVDGLFCGPSAGLAEHQCLYQGKSDFLIQAEGTAGLSFRF